jgi:hypothetical protein
VVKKSRNQREKEKLLETQLCPPTSLRDAGTIGFILLIEGQSPI